jgi:hypothetical protein
MPVQLMAVNNSDVRFTVHNLSYNPGNDAIGISDTYRQISANNSNATEVCVFCHTPHNASSSVQLWNKASGASPYDQPLASAYQLYTSSPRLTNTVKHSALTAASESMLCLSCHDGKTAINVLHNTRVSDATDANGNSLLDMGIVGWANPLNMDTISAGLTYTDDIGAVRDQSGHVLAGNVNSGKNLTDDHPIGFSYAAAQAEKPGKLRPLDGPNSAKSYGMRFYGSGDRVECSTCHNPHVYYGQGKSGNSRITLPYGATQAQLDRTPFLVRDNNGSALCLSCHIK